MFFLCVSQMQNKKKGTSKDKTRKNRKTRAKERENAVSLCLILPKFSGSVNCARADRVTSNYIGRTSGFFIW